MRAEQSQAPSLAGRLRPLSGIEEELVAHDRSNNAAALCNELLARCLTRPGRDPGVARAEVADMVITERDLALVALRRRSFGDRMDMELVCPACEARHDITLELDRVDAPRPPAPEVVVDHDGQRARVRLPTARDQAEVMHAARDDLAAGRAALLAATLLELDGRAGPFTHAEVIELAPDLRAAIDAAVEAALPDIDLALQATCPGCEAAIEAPVHLAEMVLTELRDRSRRLLREVHVLAREYHWSERQILSLSVSRRRTYLGLIEAERDAALHAHGGEH